MCLSWLQSDCVLDILDLSTGSVLWSDNTPFYGEVS